MLFAKSIKNYQTVVSFAFDQRTKSKKKSFLKISELSARNWRYRCLVRLYITEPYCLLLTGHTATDRAETALLQLLRGTTLHGISSFKSSKTRQSVYPKYFNYSIFLSQ